MLWISSFLSFLPSFLLSLTVSLVLNHSSWLYGIMGTLLAVITHSLLNNYVVVEQPSVVAVNYSLLSSKNRLTNSRGGKCRESFVLGGLLLSIWWVEEHDYISENGQAGTGKLWYREAAMALNESETQGLTARKCSVRPCLRVCDGHSFCTALFQPALKFQGFHAQWHYFLTVGLTCSDGIWCSLALV